MNLRSFIDELEAADASGMDVVFLEEQSRGSAAHYVTDEIKVGKVVDDDGDPITKDCPKCKGSGQVEEVDEDGSDQCPECEGSGEVDSDEEPTKQVLLVYLSHEGYAPAVVGD